MGVFGLLTLPPALVVLVGLTIKDAPVQNHSYSRVNEKFGDAVRAMWTTLKSQHVWKPCLYMFSSLALNINIHEGLFYWYTDGKGGPLFSKSILIGPVSLRWCCRVEVTSVLHRAFTTDSEC